MASLWGDDDGAVATFTVEEMATLDPDQLIAFKNNTEMGLIKITSEFAETLESCKAICTAAYRVADFVPAFLTEEQNKFWKKTLIPILVETVKQDVEAQVQITNMFASIRDLALVIKSNYDIVRKSKGSKKAVEIAQKNIPAALETLKQCMAKAEDLTTSAIAKFAENTQTIFEIIGPEAAKFVEQKGQLDEEIQAERKKQEDMYGKLGEKQGKVNSLFFLIEALDKQLSGVKEDLDASRKRLEEMKKLNDNVDRAIQNIPEKITRTITEKKSGGWWIFSHSSTKTTTFQEKNPTREQDQKYYEDIIKSRMERIKSSEADDKAKTEALDQLKDQLAKYKSALETSKADLMKFEENLPKVMQDIEDNIDQLKEKKDKLQKGEDQTIDTIGLQGDTLIDCLIQVRTFGKKLQPGASAYAPLHSIMSAVKSMVESNVQLLSSDEAADIFLAGSLLIQQVGFLSRYLVDAQQIMKPSEEYSIKQMEIKMQKAVTL